MLIISLLDLSKRDFSKDNKQRFFYILLLVLAPIIGSSLYLTSLRYNYPLKSINIS